MRGRGLAEGHKETSRTALCAMDRAGSASAERALNHQIPLCLVLYKDFFTGTLPGCHHDYLDGE